MDKLPSSRSESEELKGRLVCGNTYTRSQAKVALLVRASAQSNFVERYMTDAQRTVASIEAHVAERTHLSPVRTHTLMPAAMRSDTVLATPA